MKELLRSSIAKRVLSASLVIALVITMIHVIPRDNSMDLTHAAEPGDYSGAVVREVVDTLDELLKYHTDSSAPRGTAQHPFVVLEIVPYEEYAEIGYLIGGCEPADMNRVIENKLFNQVDDIGSIDSLGSGKFIGYHLRYFADEPEGNPDLYVQPITWNNGSIYYFQPVEGYYERVADGEGTFLLTREPIYDEQDNGDDTEEDNTDGNTDDNIGNNPSVSGGDAGNGTVSGNDAGNPDNPDDAGNPGENQGDKEENPTPSVKEPIGWIVTFEKAPNRDGNVIWHTKNEIDKIDYSKIVFVDDYMEALQDGSTLSNIGDRLFTYRTNIDDPYLETNTSVYQNYEYFLKNTVLFGESDEAVNNYSVVLKTITPSDLNKCNDWIDYADLIYITPQSHDTNLINIWKRTNHFYRTSNVTNYAKDAFVTNDFSWDTVLKMYYKVTADTNYAALIFDDNIYTSPETFLGSSLKNDVTPTVYNWNFKPSTSASTTNQGKYSNCNIYKLFVMLQCMDPYFFKKLYLEGENPIVQNGIHTLQPGDAATYWSFETFLLTPDGVDFSQYTRNGYSRNDVTGYWTSDQIWETYHYTCYETLSEDCYRYWCQGHVFGYKGDNSITRSFVNGLFNYENNEYNLNIYGNRYKDFYESLSEEEKKLVSPANATRYILGQRGNPNDPPQDPNYGHGLDLRVLDLEPSVGLKVDGTPDWSLRDSYFYMLLPHFRGNVKITHQTTAEFIGKIEDLNSTYNLIYMGLDYGGFNTAEWDLNGTKVVLPDWNDPNLDKKIYLRTGDYMISTEREGTAKWLLNRAQYNSSNGNTVNVINSTQMRFPGNDISLIKQAELEDYLNAGYPIVAEQFLYDLDSVRIDSNSYIYKFINKMIQKQAGAFVPLYGTLNNNSTLELAVQNALAEAVTINIEDRYLYDGTTVDDESATIKNLHYLETKTVERKVRAYLPFDITTTTTGYKYVIYVDLNRDSKFTSDEIQTAKNGTALAQGTEHVEVLLPEGWVGLIQWKVEVYLADNDSIRYVRTGCSAVQPDLKNGVDSRKKVNVLQIMPNDPNVPGALNLSTNPTFLKYYEGLKDYNIDVTSITYNEYESYFYYEEDGKKVSRGFDYSYAPNETDDSPNPVNLDKLSHSNYPDLMSFNMIIVGFADHCGFGNLNFKNQYGQLDFLKYYADQGKSILFTHDLTTFYNTEGYYNYSFSVNALMRDMMGMNRYASVNYYLNDKTLQDSGLRLMQDNDLEQMINYQEEHWDNYDHISVPEIHGYTYYAMKRMGYHNENNNNDNLTAKNRVPYRYMIKNPLGDSIGKGDLDGKETGFNGDYDYTTVATKVNEGQITVYPYKIDDTLPISTTHGQYYQLSPEDPNLTVWYCLTGDGNMMNTRSSKEMNEMYSGSSITYSVSPNDTMNNYYIYSKGNIFYSGVGHSTVEGDMEAKLFVNTMIAAYNAGYEAPLVEVTNSDAVSTGMLQYSIDLIQDYDFNEEDDNEEDDPDEAPYMVTFIPQDYNLVTEAKLQCVIQLENGEYITKVKRLSDGKEIEAKEIDGKMCFTDLVRGTEYGFDYDRKYLSDYKWEIKNEDDVVVKNGDSVNKITFTINNDKVTTKSVTQLDINALPLFPLD